MEDGISWKDHSFTLLIFTGIVVLCSIFFILGMLVGRVQVQKMASLAAMGSAAKNATKPDPALAKEDNPDLTFFDSVKKDKEPALVPPSPETPRSQAAAPIAPEKDADQPLSVPPDTAQVINLQVAAVRKSSDADKLLDDLKKRGFRAFILAPVPGDSDPFFRLQVGPFSDSVEAGDARNRLESQGYKPILKK